MRILCGYMPPTSGMAKVAGYDIVDQSLDVRKRVGYMPETVPLYPDMSVFEYLKFMADLRHLPNVEERVDEVLETVHMADRAESLVSSLSKGMRQRIGLAQAIVHKPEVLILDEPTIGLDPAQIVDVRNMIRDLGKERTVLLSTHILSEAQQICDRVLIINKGHIAAEDTPERLQARLTGSGRIYLKIKGDDDGLETALKKVPGILNIFPQGDGAYEVGMVAGQDLRPEIARVVVNGGFDLLEIHPMGVSLEEIFMQLTRDEPQPPTISDEGINEEFEQD